jgi:hypothetical protein
MSRRRLGDRRGNTALGPCEDQEEEALIRFRSARGDPCMPRGRRLMALSRAFIAGQKGWNRCPSVAMDLDDHRVVVLGFQTNERGQFEVLNGISEGGPNLVMRFKVKAKIQAETAWDGGLEVGIPSNSICAPLQERPKMLQARTHRDGENLIAMQTPGEAVAHIHPSVARNHNGR